MENLQCCSSDTKVLSTSLAISSMRRCTVFALKGIHFRTGSESFFITVSITSLIAGITISSPMEYDSAFFAILREMLYDAFSPPSQSTIPGALKNDFKLG
ncbi:hypothetical protein T10_9526 [Trichinella papuae]|uniref:Uncharacterized protein n=1 Tax=Trichinella papuae TaxID=268474 RepID=A0A0V1MFJ5_9BILA|nr:hypothetical protein T10_9526 [Trichinella papuae]